jgi:hypothetical protein
MPIPESASIGAMSSFDRSIPKVWNWCALKYRPCDKSNHRRYDGGLDDPTSDDEFRNGEEVEVKEDEGHFGRANEDLVEDLVDVEVLSRIQHELLLVAAFGAITINAF